MTDEEKKAIEILKDREYDFDELYCTFRQSFIKPYDKSIGIILNLIEKQQKEIEELKFKYQARKDRTKKEIEELNNKFEKIYNEIDNKNSQLVKALNYKLFMEDKIKAKIEELEKLDFGTDLDFETDLVSQFTANLTTITILQSLLNEEE